MEDKPSRGEQLRQEQQRQRLRMIRIGTITTIIGLGIPFIAFSIYLQYPRYGLGVFGQVLYSLAFILGGVSMLIGEYMMYNILSPQQIIKIEERVGRRTYSFRPQRIIFRASLGILTLFYGISNLVNLFKN